MRKFICDLISFVFGIAGGELCKAIGMTKSRVMKSVVLIFFIVFILSRLLDRFTIKEVKIYKQLRKSANNQFKNRLKSEYVIKFIHILRSVALEFVGFLEGEKYVSASLSELEVIKSAVLIFFPVYILIQLIEMSIRKKTEVYKKLKEYVNNQVKNIPELKERLKKINVYVLGDDIFNAHAVLGNIVLCSPGWFILSCYSEEYVEYIKSTLCHELSHISRFDNSFSHIIPIIRDFIQVQLKCDKAIISSWLEELTADRQGCEWYGNKEIVIKKMDMMIQIYPDKKKISSHPTWEMRKKIIEEDIIPTEKLVKELYSEYKKCIKDYKRAGKK